MSARPTVLIVSPDDVWPRLARTVLGRSGIERLHVTERSQAREKVRLTHPSLVIVDGRDAEAAAEVLARLRSDPETRRLSLAALVDDPSAGDEQRLRTAGANVVLAGEPIPFLWDQWLEELLSVPPRRAARVAVRLEVWQQRVGQPAPRIGWTVNISTRGLLLETVDVLEVGTTLDLMFRLPNDDHGIHAVGQVVRHGPPAEGAAHSGVKFLRLPEADRERITAFTGPETEH